MDIFRLYSLSYWQFAGQPPERRPFGEFSEVVYSSVKTVSLPAAGIQVPTEAQQ